ncbi:MAG: class I SAM-dependent methyltransferase [Betaproteobacteria bacterium]|nr:class I SAM-dependent methyltransferase [Betaproteobacteria bacterium]
MSGVDHQAFWDERYSHAGEDYLFGAEPNRFLSGLSGYFHPGMRVLSVADGEGRNSTWLAQQGMEVTALEISPVALAKARRLAALRKVAVNFVQADALTWTWPEAAYDAVAAIFIQFAAPAERTPLFANIKHALKPGGLLLLQGYTPRQLEYRTGGPPSAENMYTEALLRTAFADMEILHLREHDDVISEGAGHHGMSALMDLVARKSVNS